MTQFKVHTKEQLEFMFPQPTIEDVMELQVCNTEQTVEEILQEQTKLHNLLIEQAQRKEATEQGIYEFNERMIERMKKHINKTP